jgi:hypothetical protein
MSPAKIQVAEVCCRKLVDTWADGVRASMLGSTPIGVLVRRGFGYRLQGLEIDRLSCPICQGGERQRALLTGFLGAIDPLQGGGPIALPSAEARYRIRFLLWSVPAFPIHPGRLVASILGHPLDGYGARGNRVDHQRAQALDLAPDACLNRLNDTPLR